jgi:hypothetical protein
MELVAEPVDVKSDAIEELLPPIHDDEQKYRHQGDQKANLSSSRFLMPALMAGDPQFHQLCHLAQRRVQHVGNLPQPANRGIDNSALHPADVCPVEAALRAEAFLGDAGLIAEFAHHDPDGFCLQIGRLDLPLAPLHGQIRWW